MLEILAKQEMLIGTFPLMCLPQITKDIAGPGTTPEKWGKRMVYARVSSPPPTAKSNPKK